MTPPCFNFEAIEHQIRDLMLAHPQLEDGGDLFDDTVLANLLDGYRLVEKLVIETVDPFARGNHKWLLELNAIVLCGTDADVRMRYADHLKATRDRFYDEPGAGVQNLVEWLDSHKGRTVFEIAAGAYARVICHPQLFIEGNHRTACLIASVCLCTAGHPPFVMSRQNIAAIMAISNRFDALDKRSLFQAYRMSALVGELTAIIAKCARTATNLNRITIPPAGE